jgi:rhodanese-related sulfurtransferase
MCVAWKTTCAAEIEKVRRWKMKTTIIVSTILMMALIPLAFGEDVLFPDIPRISVEAVKNKVDKGDKDCVLLDVRDAASYEAGHIKGAVNIYYDPTGDPMNRQMILMALPMDRLIVTYWDCTDDGNSGAVADELLELGYDKDKVSVLSGGSLKWVEVKYPMVKNN